ncbi:MAG: hypothetical protein ABIG93_00965 [archaeon]
MRLTQKKIDEVVTKILGEGGLELVTLLKQKENISEFDLAKRLNLDIKVIRKMLYLLYNHNLVSFTRKKDKQKGWYIYYWTLINEGLKFAYLKRQRKLLERIEDTLDREKKQLFFSCPGECVRLDFDDSMDFEFHCPECGKLLGQDDNKVRIEELTKKLKEVQAEIEAATEARKVKRVKRRVAAKKKEVKKKIRAATKKKVPAKKKETKKKTVSKKKATKKKTIGKTVTKKKVVKEMVAKKTIVKKKSPSKKTKTVKEQTPAKKTTKKKVTMKKK